MSPSVGRHRGEQDARHIVKLPNLNSAAANEGNVVAAIGRNPGVV
jgi:hypothetical protein